MTPEDGEAPEDPRIIKGVGAEVMEDPPTRCGVVPLMDCPRCREGAATEHLTSSTATALLT